MATDTKTTDSSVVMALSELVRIEQDRVESDRAREVKRVAEARAERERLEASAREAERQRAERAARDVQVAEAEARLRVEADRERDQRVAAMRAELARVESDREAMRRDLESRLAPREPSRANGWALAFGLSSLVAASLAGLLVMQGTRDVALPSAPLAVATPTTISAPAVDTTATDTIVPAPQREEVVAVTPTAPVHVRHRHGDRIQRTDETTHGTEIIGLGTDDGSDDVLGPLVHDTERSQHH